MGVTPRRLLAAACAATLVLGACGSGSDDSSAVATPAAAPAAADSAGDTPTDTPTDSAVEGAESSAGGDGTATDAATVPAALQFTAPTVGGGELDAATLADKPTLFWFWAPT